jgi:hypothetical protein
VQDALVNSDPADAVERVWREHGPRLWRSLVGSGGDPELAPVPVKVEITVELPEDAGATATATKDAVYLLGFDGGVTRIARPG